MGHWVANQQIRYGGALAYDTGQYVPPSNVDKHGYEVEGNVTWVDSDVRTDVAPVLPDGPPFEGLVPVMHSDDAAAELDASREAAVARQDEPAAAVLSNVQDAQSGTTADPVPPTDSQPETSGDDTTTTEV